jgi:glycyl-tRNA synthetase beta chain
LTPIKRIKNILKDESPTQSSTEFSTSYDSELHQAIKNIDKIVKNSNDYSMVLKEFLQLKPVIDAFFDHVMVNDKDLVIRNQRLKLISDVRGLFLHVADIAYLSQ